MIICYYYLFWSPVMDPLSRLNVLNLQHPLPAPVDLTKQISEVLDLVKQNPSRRTCSLVADSICSPRSELDYGSTFVPLNTSLPNGFSHEPVKMLKTSMGKIQPGRRKSSGLQNAPPLSHSRPQFPLPAIEILSSECSGSGEVECASSDDSSMIEVPANIPPSNGTSGTRSLTGNTKQKKENSSSNLTEWDALHDSDSLESRTLPSTSEAENAEPRQNGSSLPSSLLSSSQKRAPATKKSRTQQLMRSSAGKKATTSTATRKKKKKEKRSSLSSAFPSHEPEIKLKYASSKEVKREGRVRAFAPYVRIEFSDCTVVNFEEDGDVQVRKQRQPAASHGIVPSTSCLQLGRLGSEVRSQSGELCCLCERTANSAGLGDLHGPYQPCGPDRKTSTDLLINGHKDPGVKRKEASDEGGERWVHEDCCIWSAGVFLIKGRLYGLDEALKLSQKNVSSRTVALFTRLFTRKKVYVKVFHKQTRQGHV